MLCMFEGSEKVSLTASTAIQKTQLRQFSKGVISNCSLYSRAAREEGELLSAGQLALC